MTKFVKKRGKHRFFANLFILILFLTVFSFGNKIQGQVDSLALAEELFDSQSFDQAIVFYKNFIALDPKNPDVYYKLGFCYLNSSDKRDSAIVPLKNALKIYSKLSKKKKKRTYLNPVQIKYDLARAYRVNYEFDSALAVLKSINTEKLNKNAKAILANQIQLCKDGKELVKNPKNIKIENLGPKINTEYTEHTPVFTPDEEELYFTSRRKLFPDSKKDFDNEYDENIYYSSKDSNGNWTEPIPLKNINTRDHEATISISFDGQTLLI